MAINICVEDLVENGLITIECSQVCPDSHSVLNLVSSDPEISRRGFRTEHFVRPPTEITVRSKFDFDLCQLEMGLKVKDNKTDSFEISSSYDSNNYQIIAKQFNCRSNDSFCLKNVCFRPNYTLGSNTRIPDHSSSALFVKCFKNCSRINSIKIKILWTSNSSIPCLSYLKVFAQPIRYTNKDVLSKILETLLKTKTENTKRFSFYNSNDCEFSEQNEHSVNEKRKLDSPKLLSNDSIEIPEEFIDVITNEVMIEPITLPSGHCIDKTTLDKYLSEEAKWLRLPSDPFTQLLFTSERQPKPNDILRRRIDAFLSLQCGQSADERLESSKRRRIVGSNHYKYHTESQRWVPTNLGISRLTGTTTTTTNQVKPPSRQNQS